MPIRQLVLFLLFISCTAQSQPVLHEGLYAAKEKTHNNIYLWGFKNKHNKWEIKPQFDTIYHYFEFGKAIAGKEKKYGVIDKSGKAIIPFAYHEILPQVKHLFPVRSEDYKWGFMSSEGKLIFPTLYDNFRLSYKEKHILLQKDLRWGIYSVQNKELLRPYYKQIQSFTPKSYRVLPFPLWHVIQSNGSIISTIDADSVRMLSSTVGCFTLQGKKGLRNLTQELFPSQFDDIQYGKDSMFFVKKNGHWGIVNVHGKYLLEPQFEQVKSHNDYFIATLKYKEKKIYRWDLKPLTSESYLDIADSSNGLWAVQNNIGLWGYINTKGQLKIRCRYSKAEPFNNGLAKVTLDGISYYINVHEEQIIRPTECLYYESGFLKVDASQRKYWIKGMHEYEDLKILSDNYYRIKSKKGFGILDDKGKLILPCDFTSILLSSDAKLFIAQKKNTYYLYTLSGKQIGLPHKRFERMIDASEGLVKIKYKGGIGFCDLDGQIVISSQYDATGLFNNGICAIKLRGKWGYIDRDERFVLQPYYTEPAVFYGEAGILKENNDYHLINANGKITNEYPLASIERTSEGFYIIRNKAGLFGLANASGKEIFPTKYKSITAQAGGIFIVTDEEYSGAIDGNGKIVVAIKYHQLLFNPTLKLYCGSVKRGWETVKVN